MTKDDMPKEKHQRVFVKDTYGFEWEIWVPSDGIIALSKEGKYLGIIDNVGKTGFTLKVWICDSLGKVRVIFKNLTVTQK